MHLEKKYKMEWEKKDGGRKHTIMRASGMFESMNWWIFCGGINAAHEYSSFSYTKKKKKKVCMSEKVAGFTQTNVENIKSMYKFKINVKI